MDKKHRKILLKHRLAFVKDLEALDVTSTIFESGTITENDKESIEGIKQRRERTEFLMDLLPRKGPKAFDSFCKALKESGVYEHLVMLLTSSKGGGSADRNRRVACKLVSKILKWKKFLQEFYFSVVYL